MLPWLFLILTLAVTTFAIGWRTLINRRHRRALCALAREWKLHYSADDRFGLAESVAGRLPIPGASDVHVTDLLYGNEGGHARRYLFVAEFTVGVTRFKHCESRVATFLERRSDDGAASRSAWLLEVAPAGLTLIEQYHELHRTMSR